MPSYLGNSMMVSDTSDLFVEDSLLLVNYPAKPMLYSLLIPGLGQYKNGDPMWKSAIFAGVEVASIIGWIQWNKQAEESRKKYELFGDNYWSLKSWVENTLLNPVISVSQYHDFKVDGTHKLDLHLTGALAEEFGDFISSDSLVNHSGWVYSGDVTVSKDQHFYENIGKYDQFVGGWNDIDEWYVKEKAVEDTIEIILMTPKKSDYINQRARSNDYLNLAKYAVTALMFNHVISGLEAVFTNQRQAREKAKKTNTDLGLYYNPKNKYGIGGITLSVNW